MWNTASVICVLLLIQASAAPAQNAAEDLKVLPAQIDGVPTQDLMNRYLQALVDRAFARWTETYEKLETPEQIAAYQQRLRGQFIEAIGGLPKRTPLNAKVVAVVRRDGFHVEKVLFESQPRHYVSAVLFLPDPERHRPPYPGVLVPCGHSANGKASDAYQRASALLALNGMAALIYDPIDQGERGQILKADGKTRFPGVSGHEMVGVGCILLGQNTARFRIWDGMRAIDYLASRSEVDPRRIGCTGNSGGGTMTSYLMALDGRIIAAAPSCYLTNLPTLIRTIGPQDSEQNIYGQLAFGMDHADYILMRAPKPTLMCTATADFFDIGGSWQTFRYAKRLYARMGFAERVDLIEHDAKHGFAQPLREGAARWMMRWLLARDEPITEPPIKVLSDEEIWCAPRGQVMSIEGARSVYDLNEDREKALAQQRKKLWATSDRAKLLDQIRQIAGIRKLGELPKPAVKKVSSVERPGYRIEKLILKPEDGIPLPALMFLPDKTKRGKAVLYVHEKGKAADAKAGGAIESLVKAGCMVLAVDLRGIGPTRLKKWRRMNVPYLLARSYMGMRAEDVLVCARYLAKRAPGKGPGRVRLMAVGNVGVPALHAAALEPDLFASVKLTRTLVSWSNVIHSRITKNQLVNAVHGTLKVYDLPDLAAALGDKLEIDRPVDAMEQAVRTN